MDNTAPGNRIHARHATIVKVDDGKWPTYERAVQVHETDKDGVVHFSNYFKYAEEALFAGFRNGNVHFVDRGQSIAMITASAQYRRPIRFPEVLAIIVQDIGVQGVGVVASMAYKGVSGKLLATMFLKFVVIDVKERRSIAVPDEIKRLIARN